MLTLAYNGFEQVMRVSGHCDERTIFRDQFDRRHCGLLIMLVHLGSLFQLPFQLTDSGSHYPKHGFPEAEVETVRNIFSFSKEGTVTVKAINLILCDIYS